MDFMFSIYGEVANVSLIMNVLYLIKHFFCFSGCCCCCCCCFLNSFPSSSYYLFKSSNFLIFHLHTIYLSLSLLLLWLILPLQFFLRNQVGESSKEGIQTAWSSLIYHIKCWITVVSKAYVEASQHLRGSFFYIT